jgi:phage repressor protein C with HTH and peptisase S24 domain
MEPVFENGDIIFVEKMDEIINGALMVVTIGNEAFIKKVYLENNCIRLVSLNKDYEDIRASEGVKIIGKVVF